DRLYLFRREAAQHRRSGTEQQPQRSNKEDAGKGLEHRTSQVDEGRDQSHAAVHRPQQDIPKSSGRDIARHLDEKDREAQPEQALVRQDVVRGIRGAAEINQSVTDETLSEYPANYQEE